MSQVADFDQMDNPYRSSAVLEPTSVDTDVAENELRAFVGPRGDYYLRKWAPRLADPSGETGMNWAAFFLTAFWLAYRKMYAATFIFYGVAVALAVLQQVVFVLMLGAPSVPPGVGLIVNIAIAIVCGLCGNGWYLAHTRRKIADSKAKGLGGEHLMYDLVRRGGTSLAASIGMVFLASLMIFVLFVMLALVAVIAQAA